MTQLKLIASLVAVIGVGLLVQSALNFTSAPHLGTPIWHTCQDIIVLAQVTEEADSKLVGACSKFHSQLTGLAARNVRVTLWAGVSGALLLLVSCWLLLWAKLKLPPNNSFKPTPLRGAA